MYYNTEFREYGWQCELIHPYRGHHRGTIIGQEGQQFAVQFSSGLVKLFYADEIYFE